MKIQTIGTKMSFLLLFGSMLNLSNAQQTAVKTSPKSQLLYSQPAQKGNKKLAITDCFSSQNSTAFSNPTFLKYPSEQFHLIQFIFNRDKKSHLYLYPINQIIGDSNGSIFIHSDSFTLRLKSAIQKFNETNRIDSKDVKVMINAIPTIHWRNENSGWFEYNNYIVELNFNLAVNQKNIKSAPIQVENNTSSTELNLKRHMEMTVMYAIEDNTTTSLTEAIYLPESISRTAYVKDHNIYVVGNSLLPTQITTDGKEGIVYGQSVHRNEFGINGGLFWSPDLNQLAFYRMDEQRVTKYPMFNIQPRPASPTEIRYPMAGDSSHTVTIGVYNTSTKSTVYLKTEGSYDHYLTNVTWSPDAKSIYLFWVNRDQNKTELREYSSIDGKLIKTHIEYSHPKYTEPESGLIFSKNIPEGFVFQSEHSGFNHLYLYLKNPTNVPKNKRAYKNTQTFADGGILNHYGYLFPITQGNWEVTEVLGLDESENNIVYLSTRHSKELEQGSLNRVPLISNIQTGEMMSIFKSSVSESNKNNKSSFNEILEEYIQSAIWIPSSSRLLLISSNINSPRNLYSVSTKDLISGGKISKKACLAQLVSAAKNPVANFQIGEVKIESIENQGVTLFQRTFLPPNFDPNKKYPVVVYLYGGPHAQMVTNSWLGGGNLWMAYMASEGYIVYTLDNRGSSHRGLNFENATHRNLGSVEMLDQLAGLEYLKSLSYVDSTRIGVHGWSFGGFMTTSLMTRYPGKYKVGVAGGPVIDWSFYEIMYTERYMDRPNENPDGFSQNNLLNHAHKLQGPLLMIHGADDDVVVWQHSLMFADKCVKSMNTKLDYFVYPGHKHNVVGRDRAHLYKKISEYFFEKL